MEAWRNLTSADLNFTATTRLPAWLAAMNATTAQWRLSPFLANVTFTPGYLNWTNETDTARYPNGTMLIEGAGTGFVGTVTIPVFVYLLLSLLVCIIFVPPLYDWISSFVKHASGGGGGGGSSKKRSSGRKAAADHDASQTELDFWVAVSGMYNIPASREEAPVPADGVEARGADDVRRCAALLRRMYEIETDVRAADDAVGIDPRELRDKKLQANAIWDEVRATVHRWEVQGQPGTIGWSDRERSVVRELRHIVQHQQPVNRYSV